MTHILAEKDALVPIEAAQQINKQYPSHKVITHAYGHTFFIDDASALLTELNQLIAHDRPSDH